MKLTRTGSGAILVAAAMLVGGRVLGYTELYVLGCAIALAVAATGLWVRGSRTRIEVVREVRPQRVPHGTSCRVSVTLRNVGNRRTPVLTVVDPVGSGQRARLELAPVPAGDRRTIHYRLPVHRRGIVSIGPLWISVTDPFGVWREATETASTAEVIVLPRIHPIGAPPAAPGDEPDSGPRHSANTVSVNEEFSTLRDFAPGDDVRRVHWPSTARRMSPVVRHYEEPWQRRTTVLLDVRLTRHIPESFERAVSAAASVLDACASRGELVRLVTTAGLDTGLIGDRRAVEDTLDLLAGVATASAASLTGTSRTLVQRRTGGTLVTCTGAHRAADTTVLAAMGARYGAHVVVTCLDPAADLAVLGRRERTEVVEFLDDEALPRHWAAAMARLAGPVAPARRPDRGGGEDRWSA